MTKTKLYADRKPWDLEPHYCRHVAAMTSEGLHEKSAIAAELAWRDFEIARLTERVSERDTEVSWLLEALRPFAETVRDVMTAPKGVSTGIPRPDFWDRALEVYDVILKRCR